MCCFATHSVLPMVVQGRTRTFMSVTEDEISAFGLKFATHKNKIGSDWFAQAKDGENMIDTQQEQDRRQAARNWFHSQPASDANDVEIANWFRQQPAEVKDSLAAGEWFHQQPASDATTWFHQQPASNASEWFHSQPASSAADTQIADWFRQRPSTYRIAK